MTISYVVLTHGEPQAFDLIQFLKQHKQADDKIIILNDSVTDEYDKKLKQLSVKVVNHKLNNDYSEHRNQAIDYIRTDYSFWLDADEQPHSYLITNIHRILQEQGNPDAVWMPRTNVFEGVKPIHALMYGWTLKGNIVNFPDLQCRCFKNRKGIRFVSKLHERPKLEKHHIVARLPDQQEFSIIHTKNIQTQLQQNIIYNTQFSYEDNAGLTTQKLLQE